MHTRIGALMFLFSTAACWTHPLFNDGPASSGSGDGPVLLSLLSLLGPAAGIATDTPLLTNGITWSDNRLVMNVGAEGTYDTNSVRSPAVLKVGSSYMMWYSGTDGGGQERILYCESSDGINWTNHQLVLDVGASGLGYDTNQVYMPDVIYDDGTFKMYYSGSQGSNVRLIYAESTNGTTWGNFALALDISTIGGGVDDLHAFNSMASGSRLYYTAVNGSALYRVATCTGALNNSLADCQLSIDTAQQGTFDTHNISTGDVFVDTDRTKVWYVGSQTTHNYDIIYCESTDAVNWDNCVRSVARGSEGTHDTTRASLPSVLVEDGVGKMWYTGSDGTTERILYAESR